MVIERPILEGAANLAAVAARTKLGQEAVGALETAAKAVLPQGLDEFGSNLLSRMHAGDRAAIGNFWDYLTSPSEAVTAQLARLEPAEMVPPAYKVMTQKGFSPVWGNSGLKWSLPTRLADGSWAPGEWMDAAKTPVPINGVYATDTPLFWFEKFHKPGKPPLQIFAVQIGDPVSSALWANPIRGMERRDFAAKAIRLLRPVELPGT